MSNTSTDNGPPVIISKQIINQDVISLVHFFKASLSGNFTIPLSFHPKMWDLIIDQNLNYTKYLCQLHLNLCLLKQIDNETETPSITLYNDILPKIQTYYALFLKSISNAAEFIDTSETHILGFLVSSDPVIKDVSEQLLVKGSGCNSGMTCLLSVLNSNPVQFWTTYFKVVNTFTIYSKLGGFMLHSALPLIDIIANLIFITLNDEISSEVTRMWFVTWTFCSSVFAYSGKWAKKGGNSVIRGLVTQTLSLASFLLHNYILIGEPTDLEKVIFKDVNASLFKWFLSVDVVLKKDAVDICKKMLKVGKEMEIDAGASKVAMIADGRVKTNLSDQEKEILLNWDVEEVTIVNELPVIENETIQDPTPKLQQLSSKPLPVHNWIPPRKVILQKNSAPVNHHILSFKASQPLAIPKRKLAKGSSKLHQMRSEMINDRKSVDLLNQKPVKVTLPTSRLAKATIPQGDIEGVSLKTLIAEISPEKPKRQIKMIDTPNVRPNSSVKFMGKNEIIEVKRVGDIMNVHKNILQWTFPSEESRPPNFNYDLKCIPNSFSSPHEFASIFEPLLLLECWEHLVKAKDEVRPQDAIELTIRNTTVVDGFYDIFFYTTEFDTRRKLSESDICQVTLIGKSGSKNKKCLAKVQSISSVKGEHTITCRIFPTNLHEIVSSLSPTTIWEATRLFSLTTTHREYMAITNLPMLQLCNEIMKPNFRKYRPEERMVSDAMDKFKANRPQAEAIVSAVNQKNGFVLIQGPPGTGKTKTIMSLIGSLLTKPKGNVISIPQGRSDKNKAPVPEEKKSVRLLCCAPSNAACDEIVRRLKNGIIDSYGKSFTPRIVRLGKSEAIHADVKDVTLDLLVEESFTTGIDYQQFINKSNVIDENEKGLRDRLFSLNEERDKLHSRVCEDVRETMDVDVGIRMNNQRRKEILEVMTQQRESKNENSKALDMAKRSARTRILRNCDVVCCTLSAAGHEVLSHAELEFPVVIIDEACQCIELGCLIPLKYGAKKCILVGDPNQLPPTVLSKVGQKYLYEQSLFQRIMKNVPDTVHLLSIQYRMHPSISVLPSLLFYDNKLEDGPDLDDKCHAEWHNNIMFSPYKFFNVDGREVKKVEGRSIFNPEEVSACISLVERLCEGYPHLNFAYRIGVITPYKQQVKKLRQAFSDRFGAKVLSVIDINTVDGFQGQEKDIIILSCVRGGDRGIGFLSDVRRMNVSLTRAKSSCFIFGNARALRQNATWGKLVADSEKRKSFIDYTPQLFGQNIGEGEAPTNIFGNHASKSREIELTGGTDKKLKK